ncbi:HAUS augmin-like complex subunit 5 isoform X2 [Ascaphus truei]|uniref:HAUS augmin-like complex subunit 5 isoform X2 n=1 Tax=Ascaphus truei TaxID=8439 RepID=UPI003F5A14D2
MERRNLAQELRRWVVEEMELAPQRAPSEEMLQRHCMGQCTDIWKFVIHHVYSQRNVRKMEGNLLWYQQLQQSEAQKSTEEEEQQRRKQLCREILELRTELQQLQEQTQSAEHEVLSQELNNERAQDLCRRSLLLQAFNKKRERECEALRESNVQIQYRCEQLQEISRASQREVMFGAVDPSSAACSFPTLEPEVLHDVREVCQMRFRFLRSLHDDAVSGSLQGGGEDLRVLSHKQWLSMGEKVLASHPPNHVLSALERLALENTQELRQLRSSLAVDQSETACDVSETSLDIQEQKDHSKTSRETRSRHESAPHAPAGALPSFNNLIQEGWAASVKVSSQWRLVQHHAQELSERVADTVQEMHKLLSDGSEASVLSRAAFDLELRSVVLRGYRDALLQDCRALQDEALDRKQEVKLLLQQQQNIRESCLLLEKKQKQIQILIKGNSACKSQILHSCIEQYVHEKLLPRPQEVIKESQRLQDSVQKEVKQFSAISLPGLLRVCTDGVHWVPIHELSIHRLSNAQCPYYGIFKRIYESVGLSLYKAPECVLGHVADMKKQLFFLRSQLSSRNRAANMLQQRLQASQDPDTQTLLQLLSAHDAQQVDQLIPRLQRLTQQCEQSQEYGREVQVVVTDWWEQPAQLCLPWEQRGGVTLRQWRDRWTVAVRALQRAGLAAGTKCPERVLY